MARTAMDQANRPRVFVSSTIRDFADLRSALKYWLEETGADVRMSEYVDFQREPDDATFDSCFKAIAECDYFILLVGGIRGSDFNDGTSVTQQEYRVAAQLAQKGRIKPVIFIRKDVMTALSERRSLIDAGLSKDKISATASRVLTDPEFVQAFVEEIKQTEYEREGIEGRAGAFWYYQFGTFREIVDALCVNLHLTISVRRQALLANLGHELEKNLTVLTERISSGAIIPVGFQLNALRESIRLDTSSEHLTLTDAQGTRLVFFQIAAWTVLENLRTVALRDAILSGEFLVYEQSGAMLRASHVQELMQDLLSRVERLQQLHIHNMSGFTPVHNLHLQAHTNITEAHKRKQPDVSVPTIYLAYLFLQSSLMEDITNLSLAVLKYIYDPTALIQHVQLNEISPYEGESEKIELGKPTPDEIQQWVSTQP